MEKFCIALVFFFVAAEGASVLSLSPTRVVCRNNTECGVGECCYIQPEFLVASKKRDVLQPVDLLLPPLHTKHDTGYCEKYHLANTHCYPIETMNGHCGCTPGTACRWVSTGPAITLPTAHILPVPVDATKGRRSMIYHPGPGDYRCV